MRQPVIPNSGDSPCHKPGDGGSSGGTLRNLAVAALTALPWMGSFGAGPSPPTVQWLISAACGVLVWSLAEPGNGSAPAVRSLRWIIAGLVAYVLLLHPSGGPAALMFGAGLVLAYLGCLAATDRCTVAPLQAGLLLAAAFNAALGLLQYFGLSDALRAWPGSTIPGMAFGNLRQTNQYATLCWIGVAVLLWGGGPRLSPRLRRGGVVLFGVAAAAAVSRTGMLEAGLLLALLLLWRRRGWGQLQLYALAAISYAAATVLLPLALEAATGQEALRTLWARLERDDGCASRLVLWSNVVHLIAQKPWLGWGWGELDYAHFVTPYAGPRFCEILDNAHNLPLHLAVELGLPVAAFVCGGALLWIWRQQPWREELPLRRMAWALLALMLLHSLLEYPLWYGPFQTAFGVALGWLLLPPATRHVPAAARTLLASWCRLGAATLGLAWVGYAAWDYVRVSQIYLPPERRYAAWADDTLTHVRRSWLFSGPARFAELTLAMPAAGNAAWMYRLAEEVLHYSPEPRVIERLIEAAMLTGRSEEVAVHVARYRAAFPKEYAAWRLAQGH